MNVLIVNGPNLNLLGEREPHIYGTTTLKQLNFSLKKFAESKNVKLRFFQSNNEGEIIDFIHNNRKWAQAMVINPGGLTHYSISLRDAIAAVNFPTVEVHLSDIRKREKFRKVDVIRDVCIKQFMGEKEKSYVKALKYIIGRALLSKVRHVKNPVIGRGDIK